MISTVLWILWVLLFAVLEGIGLKSGSDHAYTLTNRVRATMRAHPVLRYLIRAALTVGLGWLFVHFMLVDPFAHPAP